MQKYLAQVEVIAPHHLERTRSLVKAFLSGSGPKLQHRLLERRQKTDNWIFRQAWGTRRHTSTQQRETKRANTARDHPSNASRCYVIAPAVSSSRTTTRVFSLAILLALVKISRIAIAEERRHTVLDA
ncbi:hypothetical protein EAI_08733 [Harpegnathos saltator]|uniref:Choline/carnitine acyltransferase domain-containing protein n=1 Tax=Harpegnathos saltator TaxID=610380 RepID=E2C7G7_HARSA|nr:hypothetical protein EAI_08733 [Harpegnathos saltator]